MRLVIDTLGEEAVARNLLRFADHVGDLSPAMDDVLDLIRRSEVEQFDSEGGHGSGGWAPLAASTVERKARLGLDPRILHATGDLRESLTGEGGANISIPRHDGLDFGSTVEYAQYHQQGGDPGPPQRRPVQLQESERRHAVRIIQRYILEAGPR